MPHVFKSNHQSNKKTNALTRGEVKKFTRPSRARDNLAEAFAGNENNGASGVKSKKHSTNVKSRVTKESRFRTPKR